MVTMVVLDYTKKSRVHIPLFKTVIKREIVSDHPR